MIATHSNWLRGSYEDDRNFLVQIAENTPLALNQPDASLGFSLDDDNDPTASSIAIGYGLDLGSRSGAETRQILNPYLAPGCQITADQAILIDAWRNDERVQLADSPYYGNIPTSQNVIDVLASIRLRDREAANQLLSTLLQQWDTALSTALGGANLPQSRERAALVSLLYNLCGPTSVAISAAIPTTLAWLQMGANDPRAIDQRAEIWYEIRYNSNSATQEAAIRPGIAKRRYFESELFGLTNDPANVTEDEAKAIFRMYTRHYDAIQSYDAQFGALVANARSDYQTVINDRLQSFRPAFDVLAPKYAAGGQIDEIFVDFIAAGPASGSTQESNFIDRSSKPATNDLIFGGKGNDILNGGGGDDWIYGNAI